MVADLFFIWGGVFFLMCIFLCIFCWNFVNVEHGVSQPPGGCRTTLWLGYDSSQGEFLSIPYDAST